MASYDYNRIGGNVKGKNGMPSNVPGGGTYYINGVGTNASDRGFSNSRSGSSGGGGGDTRTVRTTSGGSSGGGSSSGGSSGSGSSADINAANAYNALLAAYRQNDYSDYLAQMRAAAQNAYDRGMSALNDAYDSQMSSLSNNLNETRNQLLNQYNRSKTNINQDAAGSLRQAYINSMMAKKNLGQQMSALGLNGGATETSLANMANNYSNARNNINTTANNNLRNLEGNYSDNLAQAMQAYNSAVATANLQKAQQAMSLENALANNQISALGDYQNLMQRENQNYLDLLKTAIANGASFSWNPTEANNAYNAMSVQQSSTPNASTNYQAIQELMNSLPGTNSPGVTVVNPTAQNNYLADILAKLRGA